MATDKNLKDAFAGESQANRMYLAFAKKAESDGFPQIAKLFRAAAAAETVHAHAHFRVMGGVKDTAMNLQAAVKGEGYEFQQMYPGFLKEAEAEKNAAAAMSFMSFRASTVSTTVPSVRAVRVHSLPSTTASMNASVTRTEWFAFWKKTEP